MNLPGYAKPHNWFTGRHSHLSSQPCLRSFSILRSLPGYTGPKLCVRLSKGDLRSITDRFIYSFSDNILPSFSEYDASQSVHMKNLKSYIAITIPIQLNRMNTRKIDKHHFEKQVMSATRLILMCFIKDWVLLLKGMEVSFLFTTWKKMIWILQIFKMQKILTPAYFWFIQ